MYEESLGEFIRFARKERGLSVNQLAEHANCSEYYLKKIERGDCNPSKDMGMNILKQLDCQDISISDYLVDGTRNVARQKFLRVLSRGRELELLYCIIDNEEMKTSKLYDNKAIMEYAQASLEYVIEADGKYLKIISRKILSKYPGWNTLIDEIERVERDLNFSMQGKYSYMHQLIESKKNAC